MEVWVGLQEKFPSEAKLFLDVPQQDIVGGVCNGQHSWKQLHVCVISIRAGAECCLHFNLMVYSMRKGKAHSNLISMVT